MKQPNFVQTVIEQFIRDNVYYQEGNVLKINLKNYGDDEKKIKKILVYQQQINLSKFNSVGDQQTLKIEFLSKPIDYWQVSLLPFGSQNQRIFQLDLNQLIQINQAWKSQNQKEQKKPDLNTSLGSDRSNKSKKSQLSDKNKIKKSNSVHNNSNLSAGSVKRPPQSPMNRKVLNNSMTRSRSQNQFEFDQKQKTAKSFYVSSNKSKSKRLNKLALKKFDLQQGNFPGKDFTLSISATKAQTYLTTNFTQRIISQADSNFCIDIDDETDRTYLQNQFTFCPQICNFWSQAIVSRITWHKNASIQIPGLTLQAKIYELVFDWTDYYKVDRGYQELQIRAVIHYKFQDKVQVYIDLYYQQIFDTIKLEIVIKQDQDFIFEIKRKIDKFLFSKKGLLVKNVTEEDLKWLRGNMQAIYEIKQRYQTYFSQVIDRVKQTDEIKGYKEQLIITKNISDLLSDEVKNKNAMDYQYETLFENFQEKQEQQMKIGLKTCAKGIRVFVDQGFTLDNKQFINLKNDYKGAELLLSKNYSKIVDIINVKVFDQKIQNYLDLDKSTYTLRDKFIDLITFQPNNQGSQGDQNTLLQSLGLKLEAHFKFTTWFNNQKPDKEPVEIKVQDWKPQIIDNYKEIGPARIIIVKKQKKKLQNVDLPSTMIALPNINQSEKKKKKQDITFNEIPPPQILPQIEELSKNLINVSKSTKKMKNSLNTSVLSEKLPKTNKVDTNKNLKKNKVITRKLRIPQQIMDDETDKYEVDDLNYDLESHFMGTQQNDGLNFMKMESDRSGMTQQSKRMVKRIVVKKIKKKKKKKVVEDINDLV